ncbi:MAG TPA: 1-deoxy-D-xylulose-5-phosphate synthase [Phycisphaerae bacterium]|nr:1-deoxy-D-xylulose-5-phosphate synthase [Phycisphaerae bacterium]
MAERLLDSVKSPQDLRGMDPVALERLAAEIRALITRTVARRGGHLASNLGVVDLTVALHRAFDFSKDHLIWDVGHQCYAHKILTGRREAFEGLRAAGGASGFPNPAESPYDEFRTGHAGASVSTALGLALAERAAGTDRRTVAVIGDGALATGLALEAMNHVGDVGANLLVILNDNEMAISRTVGAMARHLTRMRTTPAYGDLKRDVREMLDRMPMGDSLARAIHVFKDAVKEAVVPEHMFERLGFRCFGPVDGHDIEALIEALDDLGRLDGPVFLHVHTKKGRGFAPAAENPDAWHSAGPFEERNGQVIVDPEAVGAHDWTGAAVDEVLALAEADPRLVAITAAMPEGTGLVRFAHRYPDRFFDVGICEPHAVALAAGLAKGGLRPVVGIYSTFLQRAYDQLFQEVALQGLPVVLLVDRAGLVGADGPTHHGLYDLAYLRHLPGFVLAAPADRAELAAMVRLAVGADGPWAIRYPRDRVPPEDFSDEPVAVGRAAMLRPGEAGAILALGATVPAALEAASRLEAEGTRVAVVSARFAKPVDADALADLVQSQPWVLTVEDAALAGGFGSAVLEAAEARGLDTRKIHRAGVGETIVEHDTRPAQLAAAGLDADGLAARVRALGRPV